MQPDSSDRSIRMHILTFAGGADQDDSSDAKGYTIKVHA